LVTKDSLLSILRKDTKLNEFPLQKEKEKNNFYPLKKKYLQALLSIYIDSSKEASNSTEINQIIKDIVIPYLRPKVIGKNIRGLIDLLYEKGFSSYYTPNPSILGQIQSKKKYAGIVQSIGFFIKKNFKLQDIPEIEILREAINKEEDSSERMKEYWKFLFSGNSWDLSQGGLIPFIA